jgi:hypothetical protein
MCVLCVCVCVCVCCDMKNWLVCLLVCVCVALIQHKRTYICIHMHVASYLNSFCMHVYFQVALIGEACEWVAVNRGRPGQMPTDALLRAAGMSGVADAVCVCGCIYILYMCVCIYIHMYMYIVRCRNVRSGGCVYFVS